MAVTGKLPKHLEVAARTGVLIAQPSDKALWRRVAMEIPLTAATTELVDLGAVPAPTNKPQVSAERVEQALSITPKDWYLTLTIHGNDIDDDQTGSLLRKFQELRPAFDRHIDSHVFTVLNAGDGTTYGSCYDTQDFFDSDHADLGAEYSTSQDNENILDLSLDNFHTVWTAAQGTKDDAGNYCNYNYNLLVCNPSLNVIAANVTGNVQAMDTGNRELNPYAGALSYITRPELDTSAWHLIASSESTKPLLLGIRKQPQLHNMWFDSQQERGGIHYFQYHGRYVVVYGDWRLAYQGQT